MAKQFSGAVAEVEPIPQLPQVPQQVASQPPVQVQPSPVRSEFTRCWEVKHEFRGTSMYGGLRILADTKEEAIAEFCRVKCPEADESTRQCLTAREIQFRPAATEMDKPYGWKRSPKLVRNTVV